jgi:hypothetical protein
MTEDVRKRTADAGGPENEGMIETILPNRYRAALCHI